MTCKLLKDFFTTPSPKGSNTLLKNTFATLFCTPFVHVANACVPFGLVTIKMLMRGFFYVAELFMHNPHQLICYLIVNAQAFVSDCGDPSRGGRVNPLNLL